MITSGFKKPARLSSVLNHSLMEAEDICNLLKSGEGKAAGSAIGGVETLQGREGGSS